jgi:rhomboid family GlyGly-CTERM serine protease
LSVVASTPRLARSAVWTTPLVGALACIAQWPAVGVHLALERSGLTSFEWWRVWTGHVTHFNLGHLAWNVVPLLIFGCWAERVAPSRTRVFYAIAPLLISGTLLLDPRLDEYRGLSGVVMGLVALAALGQLRDDRGPRWVWAATLALLAGKLAWEFSHEAAVFASFRADENTRIVPLAHAAGVAAAVAIHFWPRQR